MEYQVKCTCRAEAAFASLPRFSRIRIAFALDQYAHHSVHHHDVRKMKGCFEDKPGYRIRIGQYQATFRIIQLKLLICVVAVGKKENYDY